MINPHGWFATVHAIFEMLYFASGIFIAVAAFWGLKQLRISKQIARNNARREAFRLAADECRHYAKEVVPLHTEFIAEYRRLNLTCLNITPKFEIQDGEIRGLNFDSALLQKDLSQLYPILIEYLNAVEAFAIFFTAGVADEELGFQETAIAFCKAVDQIMPAYFHMRLINAARYESTIKLYHIWHSRLRAKAYSLAMKPMDDFIKTAGKQRIRPIGTEE